MAGKISELGAAAALAGTDLFEVVQGGTNKKGLISAVGTYVRGLFTATPATIAEGGTNAATAATALANLGGIGDATNDGTSFLRKSAAWTRTFNFPGYLSGTWNGPDVGISSGVSVAAVAGHIYLQPFILYSDVTITDLAAEVTTAVALANFQLAIYASSASTHLPTGNALASTASMSGASTTQVSATVGSAVPFTAGMYWAAVNCDAALAFRNTATATAFTAGYLGSTTLADVLTSNMGRYDLDVTQAFGTWPDLTSATINRVTNGRGAFVFFKAQ